MTYTDATTTTHAAYGTIGESLIAGIIVLHESTDDTIARMVAYKTRNASVCDFCRESSTPVSLVSNGNYDFWGRPVE